MPFNLVNVNQSGALVLGDDGQPLSFEDGRAAAAAAAEWAAKTGERYQPRRVAIDPSVWKQREQARIDNGTYTRPLFVGEDWFRECEAVRDHFLHVSQDRPGNVAFTADNEKGAADLQTSIKVGRYLEQFFPDLPRDYRERITREHMVEFVQQALQITQDADKIEWVYTNGPHSCMAYPRDNAHYSGPLPAHPTAVYAGPDLAVAYLLSAADPDRVAARCVVWPERRIFTRIYGDLRLDTVLRRQGYTNGSIDGARLRKITFGTNDRHILFPYADFGDFVADAGDHLVIDRRGALSVRNTSGHAYINASETCACCHANVRRNSITSVATDFNILTETAVREPWCSECITRERARIARAGRYSGYAIRANGSVREDGSFWLDAEWHYRRAERDQMLELVAAAQARAAEERARHLAEMEAASARSVRRVATTRARRARQLQQQAGATEGTFLCPITNVSWPWEQGVDVRTIRDDGSILQERWSRDAARLNTNRCRITRYLYRTEFLVIHDGTRMNINTARLRGWVGTIPATNNPEATVNA